MRFSEHGATPDGALACWAGIGLYDWNGRGSSRCRVEQDFVSQQRQLDSGQSPIRSSRPTSIHGSPRRSPFPQTRPRRRPSGRGSPPATWRRADDGADRRRARRRPTSRVVESGDVRSSTCSRPATGSHSTRPCGARTSVVSPTSPTAAPGMSVDVAGLATVVDGPDLRGARGDRPLRRLAGDASGRRPAVTTPRRVARPAGPDVLPARPAGRLGPPARRADGLVRDRNGFVAVARFADVLAAEHNAVDLSQRPAGTGCTGSSRSGR